MWCCGGGNKKQQQKKPLKSALQQNKQKITLTLSPNITLEFKQKWSNKMAGQNKKQSMKTQQAGNNDNKKKKKKVSQEQQIILKKQSQQIKNIQKKISLRNAYKETVERNIRQLQQNQKIFQQRIQQSRTKQRVLQYLVLKQEQTIDSYAQKIKV